MEKHIIERKCVQDKHIKVTLPHYAGLTNLNQNQNKTISKWMKSVLQ